MPPPLGRDGTPLTLKPSSPGAMRTPRALSEVVTVSIRSVSFTRSSAAPRTTVSPRASAAARATSGSSSIRRGTSPASICVAVSGAERTSRSATGSPLSVRRLKTAMFAPMRSSTSRNPARSGLTLTPWTNSSDPLSSVAARMNGAADEMSPAIRTSTGGRLSTGETEISAPRRRTDQLEPTLLAGEDARREAQDRPRVSEVERLLRRTQAAQADSADANRLGAVVVDLDPELPDDRERRLRVRRSPEAVDPALPVRDRAEQHGALRYPFHPRHGDGALDRRRGLDC